MPSTYHHGDLRHALVEAARRLVARDGAHRVSLRAIAREAGVSHAAPYHHFADRDALLAALAAAGFDSLRSQMEAATLESGADDPFGRLQVAGVAYVGFAVANPELYRLMFSGPMSDRTGFPELQEAGGRAFEALERMIGPAGIGSVDEAHAPVALTAWSAVHGLAMLVIDGRVDLQSELGGVESLATWVTRVLGLGLRSFSDSG